MKQRLDQKLVQLGLVRSRSQAETYIKLGMVMVNTKVVTRPELLVSDEARVVLEAKDRYVSRAALKLASVSRALGLDFDAKIVLDVGSSTGGFTDYALQHGAQKVIAIELGTDQLHPSLRGNSKIELHEKTDIRNVHLMGSKQSLAASGVTIGAVADIVVADVSFISLREVLPSMAALVSRQTQIVVMVKPQFESRGSSLMHKGVIKNDKMRRDIIKDFESWVQASFMIQGKADSDVAGDKGNRERFYLLRKLS